LEAIALQHESVDAITDLTNPNREMIDRRVGKLLEDFKALVYPADYDPDKPVKKRKVRGLGEFW
jgi:ATP-dependent DNA helicase 2 subunit 1